MKPHLLENLRKKIKDKDKEIVRLLNERAQISVQIGKMKGQGGMQVYDPAQEAKVHGYLRDLNAGPLAPGRCRRFSGKLYRPRVICRSR
jgi:chorismate mutase